MRRRRALLSGFSQTQCVSLRRVSQVFGSPVSESKLAGSEALVRLQAKASLGNLPRQFGTTGEESTEFLPISQVQLTSLGNSIKIPQLRKDGTQRWCVPILVTMAPYTAIILNLLWTL